MTSRRAALRLSATALLSVASRGTLSQRQPAIPRVGALLFASSSDPLAQKYMAVFRQRLRELGYIEGRTIIIDERFAAGSAQRLVELARELADARPDVLITPAVAATVAMRQATDTIPIVMLHAGNPIGAGLIASLARPGGNVTGTANLPLGGKHVDLMREVLPRMTRLAILVNPTNAGARSFVANMTEAARSSNLDVTIVEVSRPADFAQAYAAIRDARRLAACPRRADDQLAPRRVGRVRRRGAPAPQQRRRGNRESGRADLVFGGHRRALRSGGGLRRQDPQGSEARRTPGRAADEVRADRESQDRKVTRLADAPVGAAARSGNRSMTVSTPWRR
jgi:hypothetical protein